MDPSLGAVGLLDCWRGEMVVTLVIFRGPVDTGSWWGWLGGREEDM